MLVTVFAALVTVMGCISATVRFLQTRQSPQVTGVSFLFGWLGLTANALWFAYGLRMGVVPQIVVSVIWGSVFGYVLWRLYDRQMTARFLLGVTVATTAGLALAFGLSGDAAGWLGGLLVLGSTAPQAVKIWHTKDVAGVAPAAWVVSLINGLLWVAYGTAAALPPVLILNGIYVGLVAVILAGIVRATRASRTLHDTDVAIAHLVE